MPECSQCPDADWDGREFYQWLMARFDVRKARQIVAASPRKEQELSAKYLKGFGLPLQPTDDEWQVREDGTRYKTLHCGCYINEEHLQHIPADKLEEPCIVLPFRTYSRKQKNDLTCHILIDGSHRAVQRYREGKPVMAYMLTEREALSVCVNRESTWWKGLKLPRPKKARVA